MMDRMGFGGGLESPADSQTEVSFILQTIDKAVKKLTIDITSQSPFFEEDSLFEMQNLCIKIQSALISGQEVVVGLTQNLRLFINGHLFSNECTCFLLSQNFLLFINSTSGLSHELFIYDLNRALPRLQQGGDQQQPL